MSDTRKSWSEVGRSLTEHARDTLSDKYLWAVSAIFAVATYSDTASLKHSAYCVALIFGGAFFLRPGPPKPEQKSQNNLTPD
ncbi:MAG: hypothetical protein WCD70_11890 [Alphaproteobacteria bacterium]